MLPDDLQAEEDYLESTVDPEWEGKVSDRKADGGNAGNALEMGRNLFQNQQPQGISADVAFLFEIRKCFSQGCKCHTSRISHNLGQQNLAHLVALVIHKVSWI